MTDLEKKMIEMFAAARPKTGFLPETEEERDRATSGGEIHGICVFSQDGKTMTREPITRLYLAGKITKNCWRHRLIPQLRNHQWEDGAIKLSEFTYVGPFFVGCDHGCFHGPTNHGALGADGFVRNDAMQVIHRCLNGVADCDLLFVYIDAHQSYGTIAEIERALMLNKRVVMAFAPGIASTTLNEFWFVSHRAHKVHFDVSADALPGLLHASLQRGY